MKISTFSHQKTHRRLQGGFTLVELLTVITIIVVLAAIVVVATGKVSKLQASKQTSVRIAKAKSELENYSTDNDGIYPVEPGGTTFTYTLYKVLSGDLSGRGDKEQTFGTIYWPELQNPNSGLVKLLPQGFVIADGFANSLHYRSGTDAQGNPDPQSRNPDYDLWSTGPDGLPADPNIDSTLQNEQTQDDIWD